MSIPVPPSTAELQRPVIRLLNVPSPIEQPQQYPSTTIAPVRHFPLSSPNDNLAAGPVMVVATNHQHHEQPPQLRTHMPLSPNLRLNSSSTSTQVVESFSSSPTKSAVPVVHQNSGGAARQSRSPTKSLTSQTPDRRRRSPTKSRSQPPDHRHSSPTKSRSQSETGDRKKSSSPTKSRSQPPDRRRDRKENGSGSPTKTRSGTPDRRHDRKENGSGSPTKSRSGTPDRKRDRKNSNSPTKRSRTPDRRGKNSSGSNSSSSSSPTKSSRRSRTPDKSRSNRRERNSVSPTKSARSHRETNSVSSTKSARSHRETNSVSSAKSSRRSRTPEKSRSQTNRRERSSVSPTKSTKSARSHGESISVSSTKSSRRSRTPEKSRSQTNRRERNSVSPTKSARSHRETNSVSSTKSSRSRTPESRAQTNRREKNSVGSTKQQQQQQQSRSPEPTVEPRRRPRSKTPERQKKVVASRQQREEPVENNHHHQKKGFFRKLFQKKKPHRKEKDAHKPVATARDTVAAAGDLVEARSTGSDDETMRHTNAGAVAAAAGPTDKLVHHRRGGSKQDNTLIELISIASSVKKDPSIATTKDPSTHPSTVSSTHSEVSGGGSRRQQHSVSPTKSLRTLNEDRPEAFFPIDEVSVLTNPTLDAASHGFGSQSPNSSVLRLRRDPSEQSEQSSDPVGRYWNAFDTSSSHQKEEKPHSHFTNLEPSPIDPSQASLFEEPDGRSPMVRDALQKPVPQPQQRKLQVEIPKKHRLNDPSPRGFQSPAFTGHQDPVGESPLHKHERGPSEMRDGSPFAQDPPLYLEALDNTESSSSDEEPASMSGTGLPTAGDSGGNNILAAAQRKIGSPRRKDAERSKKERRASNSSLRMVPKLPPSSPPPGPPIASLTIRKQSPVSESNSKQPANRAEKLSEMEKKLRLGSPSVSTAASTQEKSETEVRGPSPSAPPPLSLLQNTRKTAQRAEKLSETRKKRLGSPPPPAVVVKQEKAATKATEYSSFSSSTVQSLLKNARVSRKAETLTVVTSQRSQASLPKEQNKNTDNLILTVPKTAKINAKAAAYLHALHKRDPSPRNSWRQSAPSDIGAPSPAMVGLLSSETPNIASSPKPSLTTSTDENPASSLLFSSYSRGKFSSRRLKATAGDGWPKLAKISDTGSVGLYSVGDIRPSFTGVSSLTMDIETSNVINNRHKPKIPSVVTRNAMIRDVVAKTAMDRDVSLSGFAVGKGLQLFREKREHDIMSGQSHRVVLSKEPKVAEVPESTLFDKDEESLDPIQRAGRRVLSNSAVPIQTSIRRFLAQKEAVDRMWALLEIQSYMRRWRAEAAFVASFLSAVTIQTIFRGFRTRSMFRTQCKSALLIQKVVRGYLTAARTFDLVYGIILVQAQARGWVTRLRIRRHFTAIRAEAEQKSVIQLQAWWRSRFARMLYEYLLTDTLLAQRVVRRFLAKKKAARLREERDNNAAAKIQAAWRGFQSFTDYVFFLIDVMTVQRSVRCWMARKELLVRRQERAALRIQTLWRCYNAQQKYRRYFAARTVQKEWRCYSAYTDYIFSRMAIIRVQSATRAWLSTRLVESIRRVRAAVKIQTTWRSWTLRSAYIQYVSARRIQTAWRSNSVRSAYVQFVSSRKIQTIWRRISIRSAYLQYVSTRRIQTAWRSWILRSAYVQYMSSRRIQTLWRSYNLRSGYIQYVSSRKIQSAWRKYTMHSAYVQFRAVTKIQACWRQHLAHSAYLHYRSAAKLQAVWRAWRANAEFIMALADIIRVQRAVRDWLYKRQDTARNITRAAAIIQKNWRCFVAFADFTISVSNIIIVQSIVRSYLATKELKRRKVAWSMKKSATVIQKHCRRRQSELYVQLQLACILIIQSVSRRFLAIKAAARIRDEKSFEASVILAQAGVRRYISRAVSSRMRHQKKAVAAMKIQSLWRGFWEFSHFVILQYEVVRVQAMIRGKLYRKNFNLKLGCCIMIQSVFRRFLVTKQFQNLNVSLSLTMVQANAMRESSASKRIQFWWRVVLRCRKEKSAALIIERFFLKIKMEIEDEIRHQKELYWMDRKKRKKREKGDRRLDDDDSDLFSFSAESEIFDFSSQNSSSKTKSSGGESPTSQKQKVSQSRCVGDKRPSGGESALAKVQSPTAHARSYVVDYLPKKSPRSKSPKSPAPKKSPRSKSPKSPATQNLTERHSFGGHRASSPDMKMILRHDSEDRSSKSRPKSIHVSISPDTASSLRRAKEVMKSSSRRMKELSVEAFQDAEATTTAHQLNHAHSSSSHRTSTRKQKERFFADDLEPPSIRQSLTDGSQIASVLASTSGVRSIKSTNSYGRQSPRDSTRSDRSAHSHSQTVRSEANSSSHAWDTSSPPLYSQSSRSSRSPRKSDRKSPGSGSRKSSQSPRHGKILVMNPYPDYPTTKKTIDNDFAYIGEEFGEV